METIDDQTEHRVIWSNEGKIELIRLRLQGLTFAEIGAKMGRSRHSVRSEYGRIRRGETDVAISLADFAELRGLLPLRKPFMQKCHPKQSEEV